MQGTFPKKGKFSNYISFNKILFHDGITLHLLNLHGHGIQLGETRKLPNDSVEELVSSDPELCMSC